MKKYLIVLFVLIACGFVESHDFKLIIDYNPEVDAVDRYYFYPVVTVDSVEILFDESNFWRSFDSDSLKAINPDSAIILFPSVLNDNFIQFRFRARNSVGFGLPSDASNILRKSPDNVPSQALNARTTK